MKKYEMRVVYSEVAEETPRYVTRTEEVINLLSEAFAEFPSQEQVRVILLNRKNAVIGHRLISLGGPNSCTVPKNEIFKTIFLCDASAFILAHNHPSGDPTASSADVAITRDLRTASNIMQVEFLDHVIFGQKDCDPSGLGFYSFREKGLL